MPLEKIDNLGGPTPLNPTEASQVTQVTQVTQDLNAMAKEERTKMPSDPNLRQADKMEPADKMLVDRAFTNLLTKGQP